MSKSGLTAISRKSMSVPCRWLVKNNLVQGKVLDYGCGRGKDVEELKKLGFNAKGWDPNHNDNRAVKRQKYDTILCSYVLNVVDKQTRNVIIADIKKLLKKGGNAFVAVRRDLNRDYVSSRGTSQYLVNLDSEVVKETSSFCIYKL